MPYGTTIDAPAVMAAYLYGHPAWPKVGGQSPTPIKVYGVELPPGWVLSRTVLVMPNGPVSPPSHLPILDFHYLFYCYGPLPYDASEVSRILFDVLHFPSVHNVTVGTETEIKQIYR